uniref:DUF2141 domain-containing protein n=1 Tax=Marinobacter sp. TaxID=50741 RepID=UPI00356AD981
MRTNSSWPDARPALHPYRTPSRGKAIWQLINTLVPYAGLWYLMILSIRHDYSYLWTLALSVVAFTSLPAIVFAQPTCPGIHVDIPNIENSTGTVACALFESPEGFPAEFLHSATHITMMKIRDTKARCSFLDIPPGTYALAVIHDENMDGKLNTN